MAQRDQGMRMLINDDEDEEDDEDEDDVDAADDGDDDEEEDEGEDEDEKGWWPSTSRNQLAVGIIEEGTPVNRMRADLRAGNLLSGGDHGGRGSTQLMTLHPGRPLGPQCLQGPTWKWRQPPQPQPQLSSLRPVTICGIGFGGPQPEFRHH